MNPWNSTIKVGTQQSFVAQSIPPPPHLKVLQSSIQRPADANQMFTLQKQGGFTDRYCLNNASNSSKPRLNGTFLFVILVSDQDTVICGLDAFEHKLADAKFVVGGHTSLSNREDVIYAGEIVFSMAAIKKWTNKSGHYMPEAMHHRNLSPAIHDLLPLRLFEAHVSTLFD